MTALILLQDAVASATDALGDALVPIGGAALVLTCIRMAITAHDKRASVAEERERTCTAALAGTVAAQTLLTEEVRTYNREGVSRLDNGLRRLETIERRLAEITTTDRR